MRPTTRLRILDYLRSHQAATAVELGHALGMTSANIRHHLQVLESNDLIKVVSRRQQVRGRPLNVFCLSRQVLGDGLDDLSDVLCKTWLGDLPAGRQQSALHSVAENLAGTPGDYRSKTSPQRFTQAIRRLNELHYQARWEAAAEGPRIILGHCPYASIIDSHPELCVMDKELLGILFGGQMEQTAKLQVNMKGLPQCIFQAVQ